MADITFVASDAEVVFSNLPLVAGELFAKTCNRVKRVLSGYTSAQLCAHIGSVNGFAGSELRIQYSVLGDFTDAAYLDGAAGPAIAADGGANTTQLTATPVTIAAAAKIAAGVTLRVVGVDGNGTVDPAFGNIAVILT